MEFIKRHSKAIIVLVIVITLTIGSCGLYQYFKKKGS